MQTNEYKLQFYKNYCYSQQTSFSQICQLGQYEQFLQTNYRICWFQFRLRVRCFLKKSLELSSLSRVGAACAQ